MRYISTSLLALAAVARTGAQFTSSVEELTGAEAEQTFSIFAEEATAVPLESEASATPVELEFQTSETPFALPTPLIEFDSSASIAAFQSSASAVALSYSSEIAQEGGVFPTLIAPAPTDLASSSVFIPFIPSSAPTASANSSAPVQSASATEFVPSVASTGVIPSATSSSNATIFTFVLEVTITGSIARRQTATTGRYVGPDGSLVSGCGAGQLFAIENGQLYTATSTGLVRAIGPAQVSTTFGAIRELFAASTTVGQVTTSFAVNGLGEDLTWSNGLFSEGVAGYCVAGGSLYATFTEDTSFCDSLATLSATRCSAVTAPATTVINNYFNSVTYNNIIYNINISLDPAILDRFAKGLINYFYPGGDSYYAQLCPVCPIVKCSKADNICAQQACHTCPPEAYHVGGVFPANGTCPYTLPTCLTCANSTVPGVTTAIVESTHLVCPTAAVSSIQSVASASGIPAAVSAASYAIVNTITVTQTLLPYATTVVPTSTVVVLDATPFTVAQTTVSLPTANATVPIDAFKGAAPAVVASPLLAALFGLVAFML